MSHDETLKQEPFVEAPDVEQALAISLASPQGPCKIAPISNKNQLFVAHVPHVESHDQIWNLRADENGAYALTNHADTTEVLGLLSPESATDTEVVQALDKGEAWQRWELSIDRDGWRLTSMQNGNALDFLRPDPAEGTQVTQAKPNSSKDTQRWKLIPTVPPESLTRFAEFKAEKGSVTVFAEFRAV